jgi:hypothetical protein
MGDAGWKERVIKRMAQAMAFVDDEEFGEASWEAYMPLARAGFVANDTGKLTVNHSWLDRLQAEAHADGLRRAAEIARESAAKARKFAAEDGGPINYEHETARAKEADHLAAAIEAEIAKEKG